MSEGFENRGEEPEDDYGSADLLMEKLVSPMYAIPGYDPLTQERVTAYFHKKEKYQDKIVKLAESGVQLDSPETLALEKSKKRMVSKEQIENDLREGTPETQIKAVESLGVLFGRGGVEPRVMVEMVKLALASKNSEAQSVAARMNSYLAFDIDDELNDIVLENAKNGLGNPDEKTKVFALRMMGYLPSKKSEELKGEANQAIEILEQSSEADVVKMVLETIEIIPVDRRFGFIKKTLQTNDSNLQKDALELFDTVCDKNQEVELFNIAKQHVPAEILMAPVLYEGKGLDKENFKRVAFEKTGSGTTLIGGDLKDKVVMRHISPDAFLAWQKVFEDYELWESCGFDYVPIEPIISFRPNKKGAIDVATGVLDISLRDWNARAGNFHTELIRKKHAIINILRAEGFKHGHTHDGNFCLRFFRDENGKPDLEREPRLYLIDFDKAVSP
ncbi:MAG: hypothetical protein EXS48_03270 [Candidatus Staskawiczbacteria bacterium]|nr:hypothetical protein [Candidatus Staskawiczbacteria bacterium]